MREKESYLDLFLFGDETPKKAKTKRTSYFGKIQEQAILDYNSPLVPLKERDKIFEKIIQPCFNRVITGCLEMPKFHNMMGMDILELKEATFLDYYINYHYSFPVD